MTLIWTRTKTIATIGVALLLGVGFVVKAVYFPSVDDKFFQLDYRRLQSAPANVFIFRPTHFPDNPRSGCIIASANYVPRMVGRNVALPQIMAMAYQCPLSRLVLPTSVPTNHFDFLVTVRNKPVERLQAVVQDKLGYVAHWQERYTEVLRIKVTHTAPGLRPSGSATAPGIRFKEGRYYFTQMPVGQLVGFLEGALKKPVQDKTGLTGNYDFSILWNWRGSDFMDEKSIRSTLGELGLTLKSENDAIQMMVVERKK
jgi:uncharacterized protein (TIGR03435 family)